MQGFDTPLTLSLPVPSSLSERPVLAQPAENEGPFTYHWPLHTPPLRHDVSSLEQWLDLNA